MCLSCHLFPENSRYAADTPISNRISTIILGFFAIYALCFRFILTFRFLFLDICHTCRICLEFRNFSSTLRFGFVAFDESRLVVTIVDPNCYIFTILSVGGWRFSGPMVE